MTVQIKQALVAQKNIKLKCPHSMNAEYITIHNTYNDASAANEIQYMVNSPREVSYHFAVDDKEVVQGIPLDRNAWHCGDGANGTGNRKSIGIEICYSKSGGTKYYQAEGLTIQLVAQLLKERGWGIDRVKKHEDWSGKHCPHRILDEGRWQSFLQAIQKELERLSKPVKIISFYTGGFKGEAITKVHSFLTSNNWWYQPTRANDGSMMFLVGGFGEGTADAKKMEQFLKDNGYWYQVK